MSSRLIILITGANQGLGYLAAQQLAETGKYHILLGSRDAAKGQAAVDKILKAKPQVDSSSIEPIQIDLASDETIAQAAATVKAKHGRIDILLNNAAIAYPPSGLSERAQYHEVFDTNVVGPQMVTEAFLPLLRASTAPSPARRITFVSTGLSSLAWSSDRKNPYAATRFPLYRSTKAALNMLAVYYYNTLFDENIAINLVTPGYCSTNLNKFSSAANEEPEVGAATIVRAAVDGDNADVNCKFVSNLGNIPW